MRASILLALIVITIIIFSVTERIQHPPKPPHLTIYTYSSLASSWGAGPELAKKFKEETGLTAQFLDVGEAELLIPRLKIEGASSEADLIMGLNQMDLDAIKPFVEDNKISVYSWSPITLIYRKSDNIILPKKLEDLTRFNNKIILLNPHTSTPGLLTFAWIVEKLGAERTKIFFDQIKNNVIVASSWEVGYGMFKNRQAQLIFSYITSPVYHWVEEKNMDYQPVYLNEPLPYQKEYLALLKSSPHKPEAEKFYDFLQTPEAQKILMTKNYMLPIKDEIKSGTQFADLKPVSLYEPMKPLTKEEVEKVWDSIPW